MRTRKTLNKPLLRKLALKLRRLRHEEHYRQGRWALKTECGTAACIAGHAVILAGCKIDFSKRGFHGNELLMSGEKIADVARRELGLTEDAAMSLFSGLPSLDWPQPFRDRWVASNSAVTPLDRPSRIAADLLDAIADGKVRL